MREAFAALFNMFRTMFVAGNEAAEAVHSVARGLNKVAQVGEILAETLQDEAQQERAINKQKFLLKLHKATIALENEKKTLELDLKPITK